MFNDDSKSTFLGRYLFLVVTELIYRFSFKKKFARIDGTPRVWGIWNMVVYGPNISIGKDVVMVAGKGYRTNLTTFKHGEYEGKITSGNDVLIMNGVRVSSASEIVIGDDCMLANFCYLTDADWHDIYNRTQTVGRTAPIVLEKGVWIGDSAIICKGVHIGENSIIGAGSVVRKDVPANVVVTGNPAQIVRELDPDKIITPGTLREKMARMKISEKEKGGGCR